MNKFLRAIVLRAIVFSAVLATSASMADEGDKYFYIQGSYLEPESASPLDSGAALQLGLGGELSEHINLEGYLRAGRTGGTPKLETTGIGADLQLLFNRDGRFQPFVFSGFGYQDTQATGNDSVNGGVLTGGVGFRSQLGGGRTRLREIGRAHV